MTRSPARLRRIPRFVAPVLVAVLALAVSPAVAQQAPDPTDPASGSALKQQYDEVLGAQSKLEAEINQQSVTRFRLGVQINDINAQLKSVNLQLLVATNTLATAVARDKAAHAEYLAAQRRMQRATDAMHAQAVSAYINGGVSTTPSVNIILHSFRGSTEAGQSQSYADAVLHHQREVVAEYKAARAARSRALATAKRTRAQAAAVRDTIGVAQRSLADKQTEIKRLQAEADRAALIQYAALSSLKAKKIDIEARIVELEKASDGIAQLLAAAQEQQVDYVPGSITFASPIPGAKPGSPFGLRFHPILHYTRLHAGIDIGAAAGTPIRAAADGTVLVAGPRGGYGNATVIDHGNTVATVYAHQSQIVVQVGQKVKAGDVIGAVGTTGLSTGPHLHFETRVRGTPVNPTNFIDFGVLPADPAGSEPGD